MKAFVSGPITFPDDYFTTHYEPRISAAIEARHSFVMGPAMGIDAVSLRYLVTHGVAPENITVYLSENESKALKERVQWFIDFGGQIHVEGVTSADRDAAMTRDSDYDILRYMSIEEQKEFYGVDYFPRLSATERNERRRQGLPLWKNPGLTTHEPGKEKGGPSSRQKLKEWLRGVFSEPSNT
ncbi:hypothetical protein NLJ89_g738 [Agrocybe chaxingu]|uniref:Uncharacterized protein n=1 Tax=Agrocybe chaxingu TaxID=84603 RepID=A0A9W8N1E7_9AGAR|nr:hypothetical protein NLJ89_g738 [Agrocybe chaxingu]